MNARRLTLQISLPLILLALGGLLAKQIIGSKKPPVVAPTTFEGPLVRTAEVAVTDVRIDVSTQGTVEPHRTVDLSPQVGGRVVLVSQHLRAGAFVAADEVLLQVDPADYELAIAQQEASVARAELRLVQEHAEAEASLRAWRELEGERPADPLVARQPQIEDAEKSLAAAKALLQRARLDLQRCTLRAPFAARVRTADVEVGSLVQVGQKVAEIYDLAEVEVRLPIPSADAAFVDLPMFHDSAAAQPTPVVFAGEFAGRRYEWRGRVVRTEGELDRRTRQLTVVASVDDPYERASGSARPPLTIGMFVRATIEGRTFHGVAVVPRAAVTPAGEVWVIDPEHRLRSRKVEVLRLEAERALLSGGLEAGEVVVTSQLDTPHAGMPVRIAGPQPATPQPTEPQPATPQPTEPQSTPPQPTTSK